MCYYVKRKETDSLRVTILNKHACLRINEIRASRFRVGRVIRNNWQVTHSHFVELNAEGIRIAFLSLRAVPDKV